MNCQTCGAALGRGTAAHHLTCRYCGAVHSNPAEATKRPYDDALEIALDETGTLNRTGSQAIASFEIDAQSYSSTAEVPPDVRSALDDASRALDDIFGGPPLQTSSLRAAAAAEPGGAALVASLPSEAAATGVAESAPPRSLAETAPMPPTSAAQVVAAAQSEAHAESAPPAVAERQQQPAPVTESAPAMPPRNARRVAPSRVTLASDPVEAPKPEWVRHLAVITTIAVVAVFALAGIAIVVFH